MLKHRLIHFLLTSVIGLIVVLPSSAEHLEQATTLPDVLKSASELDYPPFALVKKDGTPDGFSVELLKAVSETIGLDIQFKVGPWHEIKQELMDGKLDALPLVSYSKERDHTFDFTAPYLRMHGTIFVRRGETSIKEEKDLKDKEVLVMRGDTAHEYALRKNLSDKLILTDTFEDAMNRLSDGRHDALIIQKLVGYQLIKKLDISNLVDVTSFQESDLRPMAGPLSGFEQKFCIAVQEGNKALLSALNEGLTIVITNGTYERLYNKWFGPILNPLAVDLIVVAKIFLLALCSILSVFGIAGYWMLKKQIVRKTAHLNHEIDERKKMEQELRQSEAKYRRLTENSPDMIYRMSLPDGIYEYVSPAATDIFGYPPEAWYENSRLIKEILHPDWHSYFKKEWSYLQEGNMSPIYEYQIIHRDGNERWINQRNVCLKDENEKIIAIEGIVTDITDKKRVEEAFLENERRYQQAQRMGHVGNWEYVIKTGRFWGSDESKRIYGFNLEMTSFTIDEVENCIPERERAHQALVDLIEKDKPYDLEFEIHPVSGPDTRTIRSIAELVRDDDGVPLKVIGVIHDISDQKQSENERKRLEKQLWQTQRMEAIGRLAGGVAHDFNNMLSIIIGHTEMMMEDIASDHPFESSLNDIYDAAVRSANLTRQLLGFARKQTISPNRVDLNRTIESMLKMLERLIGEDIDLYWHPEKELWPIFIDPSQIDQILVNLCVNARDSIADVGIVAIETKNVVFDESYCAGHYGFQPGDFVMFGVSDNGCGMDKGILDKLFEPFFTTKAFGKGTGLGLATVYGVVKQNHGFINVYSELKQGTTFKIYLPRHTEHEGAGTIKTVLEKTRKGHETILLVEDEKTILKMGGGAQLR